MTRGRRPKVARRQDDATIAVHAGQEPDPTTGAVNAPLYLTSTFRRPDLETDWPWGYARVANPTRSALERSMAALEGGVAARTFASGMAAIAAVFQTLAPGDHLVVSERCYGGTYRFIEGWLRGWGIDVSSVETSDLTQVRDAIRTTTRLIFIETPSNPTLAITDLVGVAEIARSQRVKLAVDNTFMTPCRQRPLALGADLVVHSTTKFLNGHSDGVGGVVVLAGEDDAERLGWMQKSGGAILSPFEAFLVLRGIKTLPLRMERHEANARCLARWLSAHPKVSRVHYPGLRGDPGHRLAKAQMSGFGGVLAFDLGTRARVSRFARRLRLAMLAESLGGVETLVAHPATMTHASLPAAARRRLGIGPGLLRVSVGIEGAEDLLADFDQALRAV